MHAGQLELAHTLSMVKLLYVAQTTPQHVMLAIDANSVHSPPAAPDTYVAQLLELARLFD